MENSQAVVLLSFSQDPGKAGLYGSCSVVGVALMLWTTSPMVHRACGVTEGGPVVKSELPGKRVVSRTAGCAFP